MLDPRVQIVLLFIITGFFIVVKSYDLVVLDDKDLERFGEIKKSNREEYRKGIDRWLTDQLEEKPHKGNRELKDVLAQLDNIIKPDAQKRKVHRNRNKQNNYLFKDILNNYRRTQKGCVDGLGNPRKCKKERPWPWGTSRSFDRRSKDESDRRQFGAHFVIVQRTRSQEASDYEETQKRFDVINNNIKIKHARNKESSDDEDSGSIENDTPYDYEEKNNESDESTGYESAEKAAYSESSESADPKKKASREKRIVSANSIEKFADSSDSRESYYKVSKLKYVDTDESTENPKPKKSKLKAKKIEKFAQKKEKDDDENMLYLQGQRLYKPEMLRRYISDSRLPYFLPKRYDWDPEMIHDLDNFWHGIQGKNYEKSYWYW